MKSYLGYIYKITLPDGRYYFGKREKSNILSYYFGGGRIINDWFIKHTEETKLKMRQNHADFSGDKSPSFGRKLTELQKIQISKTHKGRHWYNNGKTCIFAYNCPEGYIKGRKYD